jgi:hypothetical protein
MKESDPRIKEFTDWYHLEYKAKYGNPPFWDGKIFKAMPKTLAYFDGISKDGDKTGLEEMKIAAKIYLKRYLSPWVVENKHPIMHFLTNPHLYLNDDPPPQLIPARVPPPPVSEVFKKQQEAIFPCDMKKFKDDYLNGVLKNPIGTLKGFIQYGSILKKINPNAWESARTILKEVIGEKRCKEVYLTMKTHGLVSSIDQAIKKEGNHARTLEGSNKGDGQGRMAVVQGGGPEAKDLCDQSPRRDEAGETPAVDSENELRGSGEEEIRKCIPGNEDSLRD